MIKTEKRGFGYKIVFSGILKIAEIQRFANDFTPNIKNPIEFFSIYLDLRSIQYFAKDAQIEFDSFRTFLKKNGLIRSTIILNRKGDEIKMNLLKLPFDNSEKILYSSTDYNFEIDGINWLTREIDPYIRFISRKKGIADNMKSQC